MSGGDDIRKAVSAAAEGSAGEEDRDALNLALSEFERNDIGNGDRLVARHGADLLFVRGLGWHVWAGTHWSEEGADDELRKCAHDTARSILEEVAAIQKRGLVEGQGEADFAKEQEGLFNWSYASGTKPRVDAMIVEATPYLSVSLDKMDADPMLLNLANGTLPLVGACDQLRAHRREDRITKIMKVAFEPDAPATAWLNFTAQVQPDIEQRGFVQRYAGYRLSGKTNEEVLLFNIGGGNDGKSTFMDILTQLMSGYAAVIPFESLTRSANKQGSEATPDLARLPRIRLVTATELERGSELAESKVKSWTGQDVVTARHLHKGFFDFKPEFGLWLTGNDTPIIRGHDKGIWRRIRLVKWPFSIPEASIDMGLRDKLMAEAPGVLNWLLDGLRVWLEKGLMTPDCVKAATDQYRADSDPLGRFIRECLIAAAGEDVQASVMYDAYKDWCSAREERAWKQTAFGRGLKERGLEREDGRVRKYLNLRLQNVPPGVADGPPPANGREDYD